MARRSDSQFKIDDQAFPVRLKFVVPEGGMRMLPGDVHTWLAEELGRRRYAWGPCHTLGIRQSTAYYFRSLADAQRFLDAFPQLELADGVASGFYTSPAGARHGTLHSIGHGPYGRR